MAIMKASKTLVCLVGESDVDFGMLKAKVHRPATTINPIMQWSSFRLPAHFSSDRVVGLQVHALVARLEPPLNHVLA